MSLLLGNIPPPVLTAALGVLGGAGDEVNAWLQSFPGGPQECGSLMVQAITAALHEVPREECRRTSHLTQEVGDGQRARWIVCNRCGTSWELAVPLAPAEAAPAAGEAEPGQSTEVPPKVAAPGPRGPQRSRVSKARSGEPEQPGDRGQPKRQVAQAATASTPEQPDSVGDDDSGDDDSGDDDVPNCTDCGGLLESTTFAAETAKQFKGAVLCRDCLLTCESCAGPIKSIDQAKLSLTRWRHRLCLACHGQGAVPEEDAAASAAS